MQANRGPAPPGRGAIIQQQTHRVDDPAIRANEASAALAFSAADNKVVNQAELKKQETIKELYSKIHTLYVKENYTAVLLLAETILKLQYDPQILIYRGRALSELYRYDEAIKDLQKAINQGMKTPDIFYSYAMALIAVGGEINSQKALTICDTFIKENTERDIFLHARGQAWATKDFKTPEERKRNLQNAFLDLNQAAKLLPRNTMVQISYVQLLYKLKKYPSALEKVEALFKGNPHNPVYFSEYISALHFAARDLDACFFSDIYVQRHPTWAAGYFNQGRAYYFKQVKTEKDDAKALKSFETVVLRTTDIYLKYRALSYIANIYFNERKYHQAKCVYDNILALKFNSDDEKNKAQEFRVHRHTDDPLTSKIKCEEWLQREEDTKWMRHLVGSLVDPAIAIANGRREALEITAKVAARFRAESEKESPKKEGLQRLPYELSHVGPKKELDAQKARVYSPTFNGPYKERYEDEFRRLAASDNKIFRWPIDVHALQRMFAASIGMVTALTPLQIGQHAKVRKFANDFLQTFYSIPLYRSSVENMQRRKILLYKDQLAHISGTGTIGLLKLFLDDEPFYIIAVSSHSLFTSKDVLDDLIRFVQSNNGKFHGFPVFILHNSRIYNHGSKHDFRDSVHDSRLFFKKITHHLLSRLGDEFDPDIRNVCAEKYLLHLLSKLFYKYGKRLKIGGMIYLAFYPYRRGENLTEAELEYLAPLRENHRFIETYLDRYHIPIVACCEDCQVNKYGMMKALHHAQIAGEENRKLEADEKKNKNVSSHRGREKTVGQEKKPQRRSLSPLRKSEDVCAALTERLAWLKNHSHFSPAPAPEEEEEEKEEEENCKTPTLAANWDESHRSTPTSKG